MKLNRIPQKKTVLVFAALFLAGVLFLVFGEYNKSEETKGAAQTFDEEAYEAKVEEKLRSMIAAVCRDENVFVFVTLESSAEYCYEKETTKSAEAGALFRQEQSGSDPVLTRIRAPEIRGVSVVCPGGSDPERRREIIGLIESALHLSSNRIYVTE